MNGGQLAQERGGRDYTMPDETTRLGDFFSISAGVSALGRRK